MRTRQLASNTVQGQVRAWIGNYKRLRHIYSLTGDHRLNKFRQCYCNILVYKNRILEITMSRRKSLRVCWDSHSLYCVAEFSTASRQEPCSLYGGNYTLAYLVGKEENIWPFEKRLRRTNHNIKMYLKELVPCRGRRRLVTFVGQGGSSGAFECANKYSGF